MTNIGFPKTSARKKERPLDLIHFDGMEKLPISQGGSLYLVTSIERGTLGKKKTKKYKNFL